MDDARERTFDMVASAALVALWAETIVSIPGLPDMIATSFTNSGDPRMYASKYILVLLPTIGALTWGIVWLTLRLPRPQINVPFAIPADRLPLVERLSGFYQRLMRAELLVGFTALQWAVIESARADHLVPGFIIIIVAIIAAVFVTIGSMLRRIRVIARG
jgi:hypothetical protein